ncbi:MAG: bacteriocin [Clostridia bacterium]|nr:bacteriocin [Clostridia bacterium]
MSIWNEIVSIVISNGVFAILFVCLFCYQLKDSAKREMKYQQTIEQLSASLQTLDEVKSDLAEIKDYLKSENGNEEFF